MDFLKDVFGTGMNVFGAGGGSDTKQLEDLGLLKAGAREKAENQSLMRGLLGTAISYIAQPKNKGYGDAMPYIGKALQDGMVTAQTPFDRLKETASQNQKIKEYKDTQEAKANYAEFSKGLGAQTSNDTVSVEMPGNALNPNLTDENGVQVAPSMLDSSYRPEGTTQEIEIFNKQKYLDRYLAEGKITAEQYAAHSPGNDEYITVGKRLYNATQKKFVGEGEGTGAGNQIDWDNMSPAAKEIDKQFGMVYNEFQGAQFDKEKQIKDLTEAQQLLLSRPEGEITGKLAGAALSTNSAHLTGFSEAKVASDRVLGVVQRSLRETLGAQFTEVEGKMLMARAYDPYLSQAENAKRVGRLLESIKKAHESRQAMMTYYDENKTLYGYEGPSWAAIKNEVATSLDDFEGDSAAENGTKKYQTNPNTGQLDLSKYTIIEE
jgi:hypothetical protein